MAGTDPGTSSLDVIVLEDRTVAHQARFSAPELLASPFAPVRWLEERGPFDLVAGPSGYGLPLVRGAHCGERELALMSLVRPDERDRGQGVLGFSALLRALCGSSLPVVFLPGVIHLPSVPTHRKVNRVDLGTPDKLCVAALALALRGGDLTRYDSCVVEMGSAFTACVAMSGGQVVAGVGGTSGPVGWASGGAWDGEVAYLLSPLAKGDLFQGGASALAGAVGRRLYVESLVAAVAGLHALVRFREVVVSGRLRQLEPELAAEVDAGLAEIAEVVELPALAGAWVKHAAQGSAVLADGLAGGRWSAVVERLRLREAAGTVLDGLVHSRAAEVRGWFGAGKIIRKA